MPVVAPPTEELIIRPAVPEDDRALAELDSAVWSWGNAVTARRAAGKLFFEGGTSPHQVLVAERAGRVVGYVRQVPPTTLPTNQHVRQIQGLAVAPDAQGAGIGRALIEAACAAARAQGARRMTLRVLGHNAPARRLYEKCGFTVEGVCPEEFLLDGRYVDDVFMGRRLVD
jgi:ribosomal protein S18 acetylase RimI-like enzyme